MSKIAAEDAFRELAKWSQERTAIHVVMSRPAIKVGGPRAASAAIVNQVLPHSQKALLMLRDEYGDDVGVTADLTGAEWEYAGAGPPSLLADSPQQEKDAGAVLPGYADIQWACFLAATFPNGNRYVFGVPAQAASE